MRSDESGGICPETLGEYLNLAEAIGIDNNAASAFLADKIEASPNGRDEKVLIPDSQMRAILVPMLCREHKPKGADTQ